MPNDKHTTFRFCGEGKQQILTERNQEGLRLLQASPRSLISCPDLLNLCSFISY